MARRKSKITLVVAEDRQSGAQKTENPPKPKDKDEEELEKLVFPDLAGWELNDNFDDEDSGEESGTGLVIRDDGDEDDSKIAALNDDEVCPLSPNQSSSSDQTLT